MPGLTDDISKGICLILGKGVRFTTKNVMKAVHERALEKKGKISKISIKELAEKGTVRKVDEAISRDVMKYFDAECKKAGVKYSVMKDNGDKKNPQYYIFYEGRSAELILHVMEQSYKNYVKNATKKQEKNKDTDERKESVNAKLAFFRDRIEDLNGKQEVMEKNRTHSEPQR